MSNVSTEFEPPSATTRPPVGFHQEYSGFCLKRAKQVMPQGVGSPGRAFHQVAASPLFVSYARASRIWDVDGNVLVDFMNGFGPMILGHANDAVHAAIVAQLQGRAVHALCSNLECQSIGMTSGRERGS